MLGGAKAAAAAAVRGRATRWMASWYRGRRELVGQRGRIGPLAAAGATGETPPNAPVRARE